jgi:6,7-dimethyl-8-ribityllumazine synthase
VTTYVGVHDGARRRIAVVAARFNEIVTARLVEGALAGLAKHGVADEHIDIAWVPGAFEIPLVASRMARSGRYHAVICLGAVIRGETTHFELVANEAARGIAQVALETGVPVIFEVLATDDLAQAESRAGGAHGNKGWEAAEAALEMAWLLDRLPDEEGGRR